MAEEFISFAELRWKLPLFNDLFLSMQGQNVMLVDLYLRDLERDLLRELIKIERTPIPATLFVSALSQMWIFAVYELLRTWRQRIKDLKRDAQRPAVQQSGRWPRFAPRFWVLTWDQQDSLPTARRFASPDPAPSTQTRFPRLLFLADGGTDQARSNGGRCDRTQSVACSYA